MRPPSRLPRLAHPGLTTDAGVVRALRYARNVANRAPWPAEAARGLVDWLGGHRQQLGLLPADIPEANEDGIYAIAGRGHFSPADWVGVLRALTRVSVMEAASGDLVAAWSASLAGSLGLDDLEADILELVLAAGIEGLVQDLVWKLAQRREGLLRRDGILVSEMLGRPRAEVASCLRPAGTLRRAGLIAVECDDDLIVNRRLRELVRDEQAPGPDFRRHLLGAGPRAALDPADFAHLDPARDILRRLLGAALAGREAGINILLYGPPGTGKTSLAATLAAGLGAALHPVGDFDADEAEPKRHERIAALLLAQRLATPGRSILLVDEAEDVLARPMFFGHRDAAPSRAFLHQLLEQAAAPVIWTANEIDGFGPSLLRRMAMCIELRLPEVATRAAIWQRLGAAEGIALDAGQALGIAAAVPAAPAVAAIALRAARLAGGGAATARQIVDSTALAMADGAPPPPDALPEASYDPALAHADTDLDELGGRLAASGDLPGLSLLLSGPSGSGKSAWARHLAGLLGRRVLHRRASDLLDPFVGGTERRIAACFAEARALGAFLIFDEADSLLHDRARARQSFEVTQVNEMLTWMESHTLPFACTTNLADRLDPAASRRFLFHLRFSWMTARQVTAAFPRFFGCAAPVAAIVELRRLVPADFSRVRRLAGVLGVAGDAPVLARMLAAEQAERAASATAPGTLTRH